MQITKILVPTDFSNASKKAFDYALSLADCFNAEVHIAYVIFDETYMTSFYILNNTLGQFINEMESAAKKNLDEFIAGNFTSRQALLKGVPYIEISKYVEDNGIDLIVIGTYRKTGIEQLIYGSTTEKVINNVDCPVLVVKS